MANAAFILGPQFTLVETLTADEVERRYGSAGACVSGRDTPLLIKGLAHDWPAYDRWSFERLARLKRCVLVSSGAAACGRRCEGRE
jgi:hypothetical protein